MARKPEQRSYRHWPQSGQGGTRKAQRKRASKQGDRLGGGQDDRMAAPGRVPQPCVAKADDPLRARLR